MNGQKWYTLRKKSFTIAACFAFALCQSGDWLYFAAIAGWQVRKHVIKCFPSCHRRCRGRRYIANALTIFTCTGCPKSSRVSQNLTIDFPSSTVSSCCFSCAALLGCAPLTGSHKVPYGIPYVEAAEQIDGSRPEWDAWLALRISFSLSVSASLHFTVPMVALLGGESENWVSVWDNEASLLLALACFFAGLVARSWAVTP